MMKKFFPVFFTLVMILVSIGTQAQDRKLRKVRTLYDQAYYAKSLKKVEKLISKKGYEKEALPYLYQSLNLYQISMDNELMGRYPHALRNSLMAYEQFYRRDPAGDQAAIHAEDIASMRRIWKLAGQVHMENGEEAEASFYVRSLARMFNDTSEYFATLYPEGIPETPPPVEVEPPAVNVRGAVVAEAQTYIGTPYRYGGTTTSGFDCSGYTGHTFRQVGYQLPRSSREQAKFGKKVKTDHAQQGDLAVFGERGKITHIAIVVSNPGEPLTVIHATSSKGVMMNNISDSSYWSKRLMYVVDVLGTLEDQK